MVIFLKYVSDSLERRRDELAQELSAPGDGYVEDTDDRAEILEDRDEYLAGNVLWVPEGARWPDLLASIRLASCTGTGRTWKGSCSTRCYEVA